jgi:hypothetical protein
MKTIEDDPHSPELGQLMTPPPAPQFSTELSETIDKDQDDEEAKDEEEEEEEPVPKKKRTLKRDTREWTLLFRLDKGDQAGFGDEEIKHHVYQEEKKIMEQSGLCKLATSKPKHTDLHLWKRKVGWGSDKDTPYTNIYMCPLETRFGCTCQLRVTNSPAGTTLEMRGTHDATSHAPEKDQSKFLELQQIEAI